MSCYAIPGENEKGIRFVRNFTRRNTGLTDKEMQENEKMDEWVRQADLLTLYHLAMCYWQAGNPSAAKACLKYCPDLDRFADLDLMGVMRIRYGAGGLGFQVGTIEQLVWPVCIPNSVRRDFDA